MTNFMLYCCTTLKLWENLNKSFLLFWGSPAGQGRCTMKIIEFLKLSDWGNLLGILSIAIGVISLWLSVRTLRTAKKIDEQIKKERIDAVAKNAFNEQRQELEENILLLEKKLIETDGLEYQLAKQVFNIICRAGSHKGIFNVEDQKKLDELKSRQKNICENIRRGSAPNRQVECLDIVGSLEQIVQRGCYKV